MQVFSGKVGIITGGAGSIGCSLVRKFLENKCEGIIVYDNDQDRGNCFVKCLSKTYPPKKMDFIHGDVADNIELLKAFKFAEKKYKQLDIVVNAAGIVDECDWQKMLNTNLVGHISSTKLGMFFMKKLMKGPDNLVVNLTSNVGIEPIPTAPILSYTSNAVIGTSRALGFIKNYEKFKTKVVTVCLGLTNTFLLEATGNIFDGYRERFPTQEPEEAVEHILRVMEHPTNGTVYEIEAGKLHILQFPSREEMKKKYLI